MKQQLFIIALVFCGVSRAQDCAALLFDTTVTIYADSQLTKPVYRATSRPIAVKSQKSAWGVDNITSFTIRNDCSGTFAATSCDWAKFKNRVTDILVLNDKKLCVHRGYAKIVRCKVFFFKPEIKNYGYSPELQHACIRAGALQLMDQEVADSFKKPIVDNVRTTKDNYDNVWGKIIGALARMSIPIKTIDKASGIVISETFRDPRRDICSCPYQLTEDPTYQFNIFVRSLADSCSITINTLVHQIKNGKQVQCYSAGILEGLIFASLYE